MDIISLLEAKKARREIGKLPTLLTDYKKDTVGAINEVKRLLSHLIPSPPPALSTKTLVLNGVDCLLSSNVPDNTGGGIPTYGSSIKATRTLLPESALITGFGSGNSGSLNVELNGAVKGTRPLVVGSDVGTYGELVITRNGDYPSATPGFWEDLDAKYKAVATVPYGYNRIQMKHSESGNTNLAGFVVDVGAGNPSVTGTDVGEKTPNYSYSSGIAHYGSGSILTVSASIGNAITHVHGSTISQISCGGLSTVSLSASALGLVNPKNGDTISLNRDVTLSSSYFGQATLTVLALHPLASTASGSSSKKILVRIGVGTEGIGTGRRVPTANSDFPSESDTSTFYSSSTPTQPHDAKIVGGALKHDKTNYSDGSFLPVGLDYSAHNTNQYASFVFDLTNKTNAGINISGNYTNCWIKLPGLTGWLDTQANYPGAGTPSADGAACKVSGSTSSFNVTFGTNSTASCGNKILLRFKLTAGQTISNVTIS